MAAEEIAAVNAASDLDLVHRVQEHDDLRAYETLVRRYEKEAFGLAYTLVGDREEVKDLLQESFFSLYRSIKMYRGEASFRTYFFKIVVNRCRDAQRRKSSWGKIFWSPSADIEGESLEGITEKTPSDALIRTELGREIHSALKRLPWRQRTVFSLKFMEGMKIREIAEMTGLSEGTVKATLFHAVLKMRQALKTALGLESEVHS